VPAIAVDHVELEFAVVKQQRLTFRNHLEQFGMWQADAPPIALGCVAVQNEFLSGDERHLALFELADAQLRSLQVGKDRDRPAELAFGRAHQLVTFLMIGVRAVAEVEAEYIGAGIEQCLDHVETGTGRAERGHDLGLA
jgi:hypothetical protein